MATEGVEGETRAPTIMDSTALWIHLGRLRMGMEDTIVHNHLQEDRPFFHRPRAIVKARATTGTTTLLPVVSVAAVSIAITGVGLDMEAPMVTVDSPQS